MSERVDSQWLERSAERDGDGEHGGVDAGVAAPDLREAREPGGVARVVHLAAAALDDEAAPQRVVAIEGGALRPVLRGHEVHGEGTPAGLDAVRAPPGELDDA